MEQSIWKDIDKQEKQRESIYSAFFIQILKKNRKFSI